MNLLKDVYGVEFILSDNSQGNGHKIGEPNSNSTYSVSDSSLNNLYKTVFSCTQCQLHKGRTNSVFGEGNTSADLMFVGEGPGADEDIQGRPFVGRAGQLLTKMIIAMNLNRGDVYIANIVKCRPPGNRNPFKNEIATCINYLHKQIELINPKIIICMGSVAVQALLNTDKGISKLRGSFTELGKYKVMPTYHPAYLLRNPKMKKPAWEDLQKVMKNLK